MQEKSQFTAGRITELIKECIFDGILPEFLKKYGTEMVEMLFRELTREEDMEISRLDGYDDGLEEGLRRGETVGLERGRAAATLELAKAMKSKDLDDAAIMELTGLSADEIIGL